MSSETGFEEVAMLTMSWHQEEFEGRLTEGLALLFAGGEETSCQAAIEASAAAAEAACGGRAMACAAGCPHCCVLNVSVLLPEAMIIAERLPAYLSQPDLETVRKRLALHRAWYRWMDDEERTAKHVTCPMLSEAGDCLIHPVRPLVCHGVTSLDSDSCREALSPGVRDEARLVLTDLMRRAAFDAAFAVLARTLRSRGFDDRSIDLGVGVIGFLEHPEYRQVLLAGGKLPDELWR
jgi:Fe-S-cluster containining protein